MTKSFNALFRNTGYQPVHGLSARAIRHKLNHAQ
jgi:hypothetical protein